MNRLLKIFVLVTFVSLLLCQTKAHSADLALNELIKEALANNPGLNSTRAFARAKKAAIANRSAYDDPVLKIERGDIPFSNIKESMFMRYTISQNIPFPGKLDLEEQIAEKGAIGATEELRAKELELIEAVSNAYYEYSFAKSAIDETEGIKSAIEHMARIAKTRYGIGAISQQEVIKAQTEALMIASDLIALNANLLTASARLKSLLGRDQSVALDAPAPIPSETYAIKTDELVSEAIGNSPEVLMYRARSEAGTLEGKLANKSYYPDMMVGVAPTQRNGRFDSYDVMLQFKIPLSPWKYSSITNEAASMEAVARNRLYAIRLDKARELKELAGQSIALASQIELYKTGILPQARFSFDSALKNYGSGKGDFLNLLDAERDLKKVKIAYLMTLLEYRKKIAALERASGGAIRE
ncbi:MAG: TolC family protein [Nitrospirota bacterium]|nr:TolC family protein [Nitrospirota bacterium]